MRCSCWPGSPGIGAGLVLLALKPWFPDFVKLFTMIYQRANMIASGKMFVVNMLPPTMYAMFDWNPLFHTIDQARGFVFINYFPHKTSLMYPIYVGIVPRRARADGRVLHAATRLAVLGGAALRQGPVRSGPRRAWSG